MQSASHVGVAQLSRSTLDAFCLPSQLVAFRCASPRHYSRSFEMNVDGSSAKGPRLCPPRDGYPRKPAPGCRPVPRPLQGASLLRLIPGASRPNLPPVSLRKREGRRIALAVTRKCADEDGVPVALLAGLEGSFRSDFWIDYVASCDTSVGEFFVSIYALAEDREDSGCDSEGNVNLEGAEMLGSGWLIERDFEEQSRGVVTRPIQSLKVGEGLVGEFTFEFLRVTSFESDLVNGKSVMLTPPTFAGHRGCGEHTRDVLENTLGSFVQATESTIPVEHVELDVQLSRDGVPIVYHDWSVPTLGSQRLFLHHLSSKEIGSLERVPPEREQPLSQYKIPTLAEVSSSLASDVGVLIEIKYPPPNVQQAMHIPYPDANLLVDNTLRSLLLESVVANEHRQIAILSFDADVCTMFALKQTRYPVYFLHCERRDVPDLCDDTDPRTVCVERGLDFASSQQFDGVVLFAEMVFEDETLPRRAKGRGLSVMTYGPENADPELALRQIQALGVNGIIADNVRTVATAVSTMLKNEI